MKSICKNKFDTKNKKNKHCERLRKERADPETLRVLKVHDRLWSKASRSEKREYFRERNLKTLERNIQHPPGTEQNPIFIR